MSSDSNIQLIRIKFFSPFGAKKEKKGLKTVWFEDIQTSFRINYCVIFKDLLHLYRDNTYICIYSRMHQ